MNTEILSKLIITKVHSASIIYTPKNTKMKRNDRPCWAVVIKYEGQTIYTTERKSYPSDLGHMVILPRGCSYEWECTRAGHYAIIEFDSPLSADEPLEFLIKDGEKILKMFRALEYKRNLKKPLMEIESIKDTYAILLALAQTEPERYLPTEKQQKIAPALAYISQNYNQSVTNDMLAAVTGLSTVYFRKLFTDIMGVSPISYLHNLRIKKAKEMLQSDYASLSDVAQSLGYASLYDFSRDFKKHTGVSPSKFRHQPM